MENFLFRCVLSILFVSNTCYSTSKFTQPLGISGRFLTTSIGIGSPPQYYDLAITTQNDVFAVINYKSASSQLDSQYDFIKAMFVPESSRTSELSNTICRVEQLVRQREKRAYGNYLTDYITLGLTTYGTQMRFCHLNMDRSKIDSTDEDPWKWLFENPIDGFIGLSPQAENPIRKMREWTGDNLVTLWLDKNSKEQDNAGFITFGSRNINNCVEKTKPVVLEDYDDWSFFATKVKYNTQEDNLRNGIIVLDFASDILTVPQNTFAGLESAYGGNIERFFCKTYNKTQNIIVSAYGSNLTIDVNKFVKPLDSDERYCELQIAQSAVQDDVQVILSKQFLQQFCVTLDYDNYVIEFAESKSQ